MPCDRFLGDNHQESGLFTELCFAQDFIPRHHSDGCPSWKNVTFPFGSVLLRYADDSVICGPLRVDCCPTQWHFFPRRLATK